MDLSCLPVDIDDELFLSSIPLQVLMDSLDTQFLEPLEYRKNDYIQSFITKYDFSKENMYEEDQDMLGVYHDQFVAHVCELFEQYLDVSIVSPENVPEEDLHDLMHMTYRFFIRNIKKNFIALVKNYISENEDKLTERYMNRKDVTTTVFRAEIDNDYDILILSNLRSVINDALLDLSTLDSVEEFFRLCQGDELSIELEFVKSKYASFELTGNFIASYIEMADDDFRSELQSKMRNKILKKYGRRKPKTEEETDESTKEEKVNDTLKDSNEVVDDKEE